MDQLGQREQEKIRKMTDTRLVSSLVKAGVNSDEIEAMDRTAMLDRWATIVAAGGDKGNAAGAVGKAAIGYDVEFERERLAFEKEKWEAELQERARSAELQALQLQLEKEKLLAQQADRERLELDAVRQANTAKEQIEAELHERQLRYEIEDRFRADQLKLQREQLEWDKQRNATRVFQLKQYGDAIRNSVSKMDENSPLDFLPFIANFERVFTELSVPDGLRVALITPYLSEQCRTLINRLQPVDASSYIFVKKYLMEQLRLVPSYFIDQFNRCTRQSTETFKSFVDRLLTLLSYYVNNRNRYGF
jgi:hypothetical protein